MDQMTPARVFKLGSLQLDDPDPTLSPTEALRLYAPNYPHLATAVLAEPELLGDALVYEVLRPPVTTKGTEELIALEERLNEITEKGPCEPCGLTEEEVRRLVRLLDQDRPEQNGHFAHEHIIG